MPHVIGMNGIHVVSDSEQLVLPGTLWPAGCDRGQGDPLFFAPVSKAQANDLLTAFGHPLGPYARPFGYQAWGLAIDGQAVAVAVSGSTVGARAAGFARREVVELARIARHPDHPGVMRVMLRLWRDYLARRWDYWPVEAAVSYALPGKNGNLYRFDGWRKAGECKPWAGGGTWSKPSRANAMADGIKSVFVYEYPRSGPGPVSRMTPRRAVPGDHRGGAMRGSGVVVGPLPRWRRDVPAQVGHDHLGQRAALGACLGQRGQPDVIDYPEVSDGRLPGGWSRHALIFAHVLTGTAHRFLRSWVACTYDNLYCVSTQTTDHGIQGGMT